MLVGGQEFTAEIIERIRNRIREDDNLTRSGLSREVGGWLDWRGADGRVKEVSCRLALLRLARRGVLELPAAREVSFVKRRPTESVAEESWPVVEQTLSELGRVWLGAVDARGAELSKLWWVMMEAHHALGGGPLCGAQLRYLVASEVGYLGGLSFSAAAWRLAARDEWIGWDERGRQAGLAQVVANSRFLILPSVRVPHLASHILGLAVKRVARDWPVRYGLKPVLLETFVDRGRHRGTCYRAANWQCLGETSGRGRQDRARTARGAVKEIWVYPLAPGWQQQLRAGGPARVALRAPAGDWAEGEFGRCQLSDARLRERLMTLARDFYAQPTANIPQACHSRAKTKAAYRFLDHQETTMQTLLASHYQATEERVARESIVLAVQDTTSLNYTAHAATIGLGPIGAAAKGTQGLQLHNTLAFNVAGTPLGFLDVQCWARDPAETGQKEQRRRQLPIEERESGKWLKSYRALAAVQARLNHTTVVTVGDREADLYDFFREATRDPKGPKLLVRAAHNRQLQDEQGRLWETLAAQPASGSQVLAVPRSGQRPARTARLAIRFAAVSLLPTSRHTNRAKDAPAIPVWAILAQEEEAPAKVAPLEWMLVTTLPVESFAQASEKLLWYARRWSIEVLHRTLKSGCRIEQRQLGQADRLEACLAIDLVVAWRIYHLSKLGREVPDAPCTLYFEEAEWQALMVFTDRNPVPPCKPPTMREATHRVAGLGGFLGRKGDGEPGTQTLWLGLQRLDDITGIYQVMTDVITNATQIPVSSKIDSG